MEALATMKPEGEDVWVLAGDITSLCNVFEAAKHYKAIDAVNPAVPKVLVCGNHEYWDMKPEKTESNLRVALVGLPNFYILDNSSVEIQGRRFTGGTMWFDDVDGLNQIYENFSDFRRVKGFVPWVYNKHRDFRKMLEQNLRSEDIVVTHHLPLYKSIPERFRSSDFNRFYMSDCTKLIGDRQPSAWFHGHCHSKQEYLAGSTRIVCNPRGHPGFGETTGFVSNLVVDIE